MTTRARAPLPGLAEGDIRLDAATSRYLSGSLRLREGEELVVFDPDRAREAQAVIVRIDRGIVVLRVGPLREARVKASRPVTWIQGVAKGDKMDAIVRDVTELGATRFVPALTAFAVVKLDASRGPVRRERWDRIAREAARQSGRGDAPEILAPCAWSAALAVASFMPSPPPPGTPPWRFCLYERGEDPLGPALERALREGGPLAFAAGPEGGLDPREVEEARGAGWTVASLGALVLRTETVAAAVLGAVRVMGG